MASKKILVYTGLVLVAFLAGIFYWPTKNQTIFKEATQRPSSANQLPLTQEQEKEIITSTPFQASDEISRANQNKKQIIFTFDAGAGANSLAKILTITKNHGIKTTFFVTGKFAQNYPELIKQIAQDGHEIFNHTYSHPHLTQIADEQIKEEIENTEQIINDLTGLPTKPYFRPPYGDRNIHVLALAQNLGYQSVFWTFDALDWMIGKTEEETKRRIYQNLKNGAIILMHIGDDITGNILDEVFTKIEIDGYKIVSLTEGIKP